MNTSGTVLRLLPPLVAIGMFCFIVSCGEREPLDLSNFMEAPKLLDNEIGPSSQLTKLIAYETAFFAACVGRSWDSARESVVSYGPMIVKSGWGSTDSDRFTVRILQPVFRFPSGQSVLLELTLHRRKSACWFTSMEASKVSYVTASLLAEIHKPYAAAISEAVFPEESLYYNLLKQPDVEQLGRTWPTLAEVRITCLPTALNGNHHARGFVIRATVEYHDRDLNNTLQAYEGVTFALRGRQEPANDLQVYGPKDKEEATFLKIGRYSGGSNK